MQCDDIPTALLARRVAVIDVAADSWHARRQGFGLTNPDSQKKCLFRLEGRGKIERLRRGLYRVVDPARETPLAAIASGVCADIPHYITSDLALVMHGLIDQPVPTVTVVTIKRIAPLWVSRSRIRFATTTDTWIADAERSDIGADIYPAMVASRVQAVLDALREPKWMYHSSLLPEVIAHLDPREIERLASRALGVGSAPAQRLGYLLQLAGQDVPPALIDFHPTGGVVRLDTARKSRTEFSTRWRVQA